MIFKGQYDHFLIKLFTNSPRLRFLWTDEVGNNLLHLAVYEQNIRFIKFAIQILRFPIDCLNRQRQTPILISTMIRNHQISTYLLEMGASIFKADRTGISPILFIARQNDFGAFKFALNTINPLHSPHIQVSLMSLIQVLIYDQNWLFVSLLFSKFPYLTKISFILPVDHCDSLMSSSLIWDAPALINYLIKYKIINPDYILHQAIILDKLEIVKLVISNGIPPGISNPSSESSITLAIKNNRPHIVRFLLSLGGWTIFDTSSMNDFVFIITNGASFSASLPSRILFESRGGILNHFINYFLNIKKTLQFNPRVLATICLQLEIFLFHYVSTKPLTSDIITNLPNLISVKKMISELIIHSDRKIRSKLYRRLINVLLNSIHLKNHQYIRNFVINLPAHQIRSEDFLPCIDRNNIYLIHEYNSIIN